MAADDAGNSYVTGYYSGTVDFDLSSAHDGDGDVLTARGETDVFVAKYAPDDSLLWVRSMGGDAVNPGAIVDVGRTIAVNGSGNVLITGEFHGSADFSATTLTSAGVKDGFVAKFDASGNMAWVKQVALDTGRADGIGVDALGNVYAMAKPNTTTFQILKFGASGQTIWSKSISTLNSSDGDLAVAANGNVFAIGDFSQTVDFDPGPNTKNVAVGARNASFVLKLDSSGNFGWVSAFSGTGQAYARTVDLDDSGNIVVGGQFRGAIDFNPGSGVTTLSATAGGGFVTKLNASGKLVWAKELTGGNVNGVAFDATGNVYAVGTFNSTIDLKPGAAALTRTSAGDGDAFVVKLSSAGNFSWGETFGGVGLDIGWGVAVDAMGDVHVAGYYADAVDFDPSPLANSTLGESGGRRNGFRLKLRQS